MIGITGYVSIMVYEHIYLKYNKLDKLKHDLYCLSVAGFSGTSSGLLNQMYEDRRLKISDVKKKIVSEERKMKLKKINDQIFYI